MLHKEKLHLETHVDKDGDTVRKWVKNEQSKKQEKEPGKSPDWHLMSMEDIDQHRRVDGRINDLLTKKIAAQMLGDMAYADDSTFMAAGGWGSLSTAHRYVLGEALKRGSLVNANAIDNYAIKLPEGYIRQGDYYKQDDNAKRVADEYEKGAGLKKELKVTWNPHIHNSDLIDQGNYHEVKYKGEASIGNVREENGRVVARSDYGGADGVKEFALEDKDKAVRWLEQHYETSPNANPEHLVHDKDLLLQQHKQARDYVNEVKERGYKEEREREPYKRKKQSAEDRLDHVAGLLAEHHDTHVEGSGKIAGATRQTHSWHVVGDDMGHHIVHTPSGSIVASFPQQEQAHTAFDTFTYRHPSAKEFLPGVNHPSDEDIDKLLEYGDKMLEYGKGK